MNVVNTKQAAEELNVSERRVRQFCQEGRLGTQLGNIWVITRPELNRFKKKVRQPGQAGWLCRRS